MSKISTRACRCRVQSCQEFQCHGSLYAKWTTAADGTRLYVVYSYGEHWPLFVNNGGTWYENSSSRSRTTSCHRGKAHPHCTTIPVPCRRLRQFVEYGADFLPEVAPLVAVSA